MQDNQEVVELAPLDIDEAKISRKGPSSVTKLLGTLASGAAVAGGLFAGSMFMVSNAAETNSKPDSLGDPAFADANQANQSSDANSTSNVSSFSGAPAYSGASKPALGVVSPIPGQPPQIVLSQLDFGTTSSATQASGGYGSGTGNTTNSTQASGSYGSGTGNTTNSTQAGSGKGEYESGEDSGKGEDRQAGGERGD